MQPLVCCFKGIWLHPYTITPAKLAPDMVRQGHLRSENDAITSWFMVEADTHLRPPHTSLLDIYKVFVALVCCLTGIWLHPYTVTWAKLAPDLVHEECKWCHYFMVEADFHLRPLQMSMLDIYKVFEALVCYLKGIWLHPYTVTQAKLASDLVRQGHLRSENDAITLSLRMIPTSDLFIHLC